MKYFRKSEKNWTSITNSLLSEVLIEFIDAFDNFFVGYHLLQHGKGNILKGEKSVCPEKRDLSVQQAKPRFQAIFTCVSPFISLSPEF